MLVRTLAVVSFVVVMIGDLHAADADKPIWSKRAISIRDCGDPQPIHSPNGVVTIRRRCQIKDGDPITYLQVRTSDGNWQDVELDEGAKEVLWSPDSRAFLVNGGFNAYSGFSVAFYFVSSNAVRKASVTNAVQYDMLATFRPCDHIVTVDLYVCEHRLQKPEFNVSGLAWINGSEAIKIFAEIPCNSGYGNAMCQVQGYEVRIVDGSIVRKLTARQVKAQ